MLRKSPLRRHARKDPVTPELRELVFRRDQRSCIAPRVDAMAGECRDRFGNLVRPSDEWALTLEHVQVGYGSMGLRAPSVAACLLTVCFGHHLGGWSTGHKDAERAYLARVAA